MNTDTRPVADILARYSTDNQNPVTIDVQVAKCREWCDRNGYQVGRVFADEAVSGMKATRDGYEQCMLHLSMGGAEKVVVYDQSRMFRGYVEWFQFRQAVERLGASVSSVTQPLVGGDLHDPAVFINEAATAMLNHAQVLITRQKTIDALKFNARKGTATGGKPALGYDIGPDKRYVINKKEAAAVQIIFRMYAAGESYKKIIDTLNAQGYKTKRGGDFGANSLHDILKNPKYKGTLVYGATVRSPAGGRNNHKRDNPDAVINDGAVPAIIEKELWDTVQAKIKKRIGSGGRYSAKREYPLTGRVFCGDCGAGMVTIGSKGGAYHYYTCGHKLHGDCKAKNIQIEWLEQKAAQCIKDVLTDPANMEKLLDVAQEQQRNMTVIYDTKRAENEGKYATVCRQLDNAINAVLEGLASSELKARIKSLEAEKAKLEKESRALDKDALHVGLDDDMIKKSMQRLAEGDATTPEGRKLLLSVVRRILVYKEEIIIETVLTKDGSPPDPTPKGGKSIKRDGWIKVPYSEGDGQGSPKRTSLYGEVLLFI